MAGNRSGKAGISPQGAAKGAPAEVLLISFDSPHVDRRILLFARTLMESGYRVKILAPCAAVEEGFEDIEIENVLKPDGHVYALNPFKEFIRRNSPELFFNIAAGVYRKFTKQHEHIPFLKEMMDKAATMSADVCICVDLPALPIGCALKRENNTLLVYDAHEFYTGQVNLTKRQKAHFQKLEKDLIRSADAVITVNDDIAELFKKTYGLKEVEVVLNAVETCALDKKFLHDRIGIDRDKKIVLYQGGFVPHRNLAGLVKAASFLKNGVMVMLGWGPLEKELKDAASRLGILGSRIFFVPRISQRELLSYTASAAVGVIPYPAVDVNTTFCTPNKFFEYVSAGVPMAVNNELVTVRKLIEGYGIGEAVDFGDEEAAAARIDGLIGSGERLDAFGKNLRRAQKELNWEHEGKKVTRIVAGLLRGRAGAPAPSAATE